MSIKIVFAFERDQRHTTFSFESGICSVGAEMYSGKFSHVVDLACLLIVGLVNALLGLVIPPFKRGFFCDDESIKYPHTSEETLPTWVLLLISVILPVVTVSDSVFNALYWFE